MSEMRVYVDGVDLEGTISVDDLLRWGNESPTTRKPVLQSIVDTTFPGQGVRVDNMADDPVVEAEPGMQIERATNLLHVERAVITNVHARTFSYVRTDSAAHGLQLTAIDGRPWYKLGTEDRVVVL